MKQEIDGQNEHSNLITWQTLQGYIESLEEDQLQFMFTKDLT